MNLKVLIYLGLCLAFIGTATTITTVSSFQELAQTHCSSFPIDILYRLSTGQLAEVYGANFKKIDCYMRQFVNKGSMFSI